MLHEALIFIEPSKLHVAITNAYLSNLHEAINIVKYSKLHEAVTTADLYKFHEAISIVELSNLKKLSSKGGGTAHPTNDPMTSQSRDVNNRGGGDFDLINTQMTYFICK